MEDEPIGDLVSRLDRMSFLGLPTPARQLSTSEQLEQARQSWRNHYAQHGEDVGDYVIRRALPFLSTIHNVAASFSYGNAKRRINEGRHLPEDIQTVAKHEAMQANDENRGLGGQILSAAAHIPGMAGEALAGGAALKSIGLAESAAAEGSTLLGRTAAAIRSPAAWGRNLAQTAAMPSMWVPQWTEANERAGRDPLDPRALPSAVANGFLNTAVLGSLGGAGNAITRRGVAGAAARVLTRTGTGMLEQQGVDVLASAVSEYLPEVYKLNTGYGIGGAILRGTGDEALRHALTQAVTFGAFSVMHELQTPHAAAQELKEVFHEAKEAGLPPQKAAKAVTERYQNMQKLHEEHEHLAAQGPEPGIDRTQGQQPPPPTPDRIPIPREVLEGIATALGIKTKIGRKPLTDVQLAKQIENSGGGKFLRDEEARVNPPKVTETIPQPQNEQPVAQQPPSTVPTTPEARPVAEATNVGQTAPDAGTGQSGSPVGQETAPVEAPKTEAAPGVGSRTKPIHEEIADAKERVIRVAKENGLTQKETHVLMERAKGRTQEDIGKNDLALTRERVRQIERRALDKLGVEGSIDKLLVGEMSSPESGSRSDVVVPETISAEGASTVSAESRRGKKPNEKNIGSASTLDDLQKKLNGLYTEYQKEKRRGTLTEEKQAGFQQRFRELDARIAQESESLAPSSRAGNGPEPPLPEPQGQATPPPGPLEANQGQGGGASPAGTSQPVPGSEAVGGAAQGTGRPPVETQESAEQRTTGPRPGEAVPPPSFRETGGTFGEGPLERVGDNRTLGLAKEKIQEKREAKGVDPIEKELAHSDPALWEMAGKLNEANPAAVDKLAHDVAVNRRPVNDQEQMQILRRMLSIENRLEQISDQYRKEGSGMTDRAIQTLAREKAELMEKSNIFDKAADVMGTNAGRVLRIQRLLTDRKYELAGLLRSAQEANPKKPLSEEHTKQLEDAAFKIKELENELAKAREEANKQAETPEGASPDIIDKINDIKVKVNKQKSGAEKIINSRAWEAKSDLERGMDWFRKLRVAYLISGLTTNLRIGASGIARTITPALDNLVGSGWRLVPGVNPVAEKATLHGQAFDPAIEAAALKYAKDNVVQTAKDYILKGESELDNLHAPTKRGDAPRTYLDYLGNVHAAEKSIAILAAYERTRLYLEKSAKERGETMSPRLDFEIREQAYQEYQRAKFQADHALTEFLDNTISRAKRSESGLVRGLGHIADQLVPIRKIPTNIVLENFERLMGVPIGLGKIGMAKATGTSLTTDQANTIMRQLKKGSLGIAAMSLGLYLGSDKLGGLYSGRRRDEELRPGEVDTGIGKIPNWATAHEPLFAAMHFGAAIRREQDKIEKGERVGLATGTVRSLGAMLEEVPYLREQKDIAQILHGNIGPLARSYAIPALLHEVARQTDTQDGSVFSQPIRRRPQGIVENIEMGIPGLRRRVPN